MNKPTCMRLNIDSEIWEVMDHECPESHQKLVPDTHFDCCTYYYGKYALMEVQYDTPYNSPEPVTSAAVGQ